MNFKEIDEPIYTSEPHYDLLVGGYIKPEELLEGDDAQRVADAVKLVQEFMDEAESEGIIEIG